MFVSKLLTANKQVTLVKPNVKRDAPLGVEWLKGDAGRETLRLMGVSDADNKASNFKKEKKRIQEFIDKQNQYNWMIKYKTKVVGTVWAELEPTEHLGAPAVHIMIGDPEVRGKGVGTAALQAVTEWLQTEKNYKIVYSRHLTSNAAPARINQKLGFKPQGAAYTDSDGLEFQNVVLGAKQGSTLRGFFAAVNALPITTKVIATSLLALGIMAFAVIVVQVGQISAPTAESTYKQEVIQMSPDDFNEDPALRDAIQKQLKGDTGVEQKPQEPALNTLQPSGPNLQAQ